ncbi:lytic transglycosylase domain-containing protein [Streptomyces sp. NPDC001820]|uniref:lytic transglycosylase domain-containing protein n=1 Tax=Streptomyces sp. NPDC001820 TaxID=3364613 RepID=UPI0036BD7A75
MTGRNMAGRKRKGVRAAAAATAAMAALTASQAPAPAAHASAPAQRPSPPPGHSVSGDTPYRTELPPLQARRTERGGTHGSAATAGGALPATVIAAYRQAESDLARSAPGCRLRWQLLAAIGQVESGQARGGRVSADGTTVAPILGPRLDGNGFAVIRDTDDGVHDGDTAYDRAVGPMQFIPSTWATWGSDGNSDGRSDPGNVYDAALAAGRYLCAGGRDLSEPHDLDLAILGYNHSTAYLRTVKAWFGYFLDGHRVVPDHVGSATRPAEAPRPKQPRTSAATAPARPAEPRGASPGPSSPTPSPSPSKTAPGDGPKPAEPVLPVPTSDVELPGDGVLPRAGSLTGS